MVPGAPCQVAVWCRPSGARGWLSAVAVPVRGRAGASPVLMAMGYDPELAASGLRLSLGPWLDSNQLDAVPVRFERARQAVVDGHLG